MSKGYYHRLEVVVNCGYYFSSSKEYKNNLYNTSFIIKTN